MKAKLIAGAVAALAVSFALAQPSDVREREISVPKCAAPIAKVIVSEIKCKSADCSSGAGQQDPKRYRWWEYAGAGNTVKQPTYTALSQTAASR